MIKILKIVFIIIGTFVGAGFASGKEIYLFFYKYGIYGLFGIIISSISIAYIVYKSITISKKNNIKNYDDFLEKIIKNKKIKLILKNIINIFLILSFCVMISGFCGFAKQEFNINFIFSYLFIMTLCIYIFYKDVSMIMKINDFIIPIILVIIVYFSIMSIFNGNSLNQISSNANHINILEFFNNNSIKIQYLNNNFLVSCILYANYNLLSIVPITIALSRLIDNTKNAKKICIISCICIIILSLSVYFLLNLGNTWIWQLDMPIVNIIGKYGLVYKYVYCIIIGSAIITTALSVGYGYLQRFKCDKKKYAINNILLIICTIISSKIGFSRLVEILYPTFGVIGIIQSIYIVRSSRNMP